MGTMLIYRLWFLGFLRKNGRDRHTGAEGSGASKLNQNVDSPGGCFVLTFFSKSYYFQNIPTGFQIIEDDFVGSKG